VGQVFGNKFEPKDVMIGETGWPSEGRQRETALPSRVNEARFIRGFVIMAGQQGWHYNLIEAFDQPWKRASEGAVGGYWGLFDADRQDKGVLAGPVSNVPYWSQWLVVGGFIFLGTLILGGRVRSTRAALVLPLARGIRVLPRIVVPWRLRRTRQQRRFGQRQIARRLAAFRPPERAFPRGYNRLYAAHIGQADKGCDFDFLEGTAPTPEPEIH